MTNPAEVPDPDRLHDAMVRRLHRRAVVTGEIRLPAVPGLIDEYVSMCEKIFSAVGSEFSPDQVAHLRSVLQGQLDSAYGASQRSDIAISFNSPVGTVLNYSVKPEWMTIDQTYENWVATRQPPLFGTEPDARVWALANEATDPGAFPVLDIGAGTGRNALALARRGHPVDVVEVTPTFANMIGATVQQESLNVRVFQRNVFATSDGLRDDYQLIVLSEVVPEFRTPEELRKMFELAANHLAPGGRLVFNTFVAKDGLVVDGATRQLSEQVYSNLFTWDEVNRGVLDLPLDLVADDSVHDYEEANLPAGAWPPTGWYSGWVAGQDLYDLPREQCPNEMRWLVYQKRG